MNQKDLGRLEKSIGYEFHDRSLLELAMRHSSYTNEHRMEKYECNERIEFLGDAVLEITVSDELYRKNPTMSEGEMSRLRASIVCEPTLAFCSNEFSLGEYIFLGKGEEMMGGRKRESIISDACESLIGAIYLDGGMEPARAFIHRFILNDLEHKKLFFDSKTVLQEMIQAATKDPLSYEIVSEQGPDHDKTFVAQAKLSEQVIGQGSGHTKKAAEAAAAYAAILKLREGNVK